MSSSGQVETLADLRIDFLNKAGLPTGITANNTIADRYLNQCLHDIHIKPGHTFPWQVRRAYVLTHATYTTGTVDIAAATRTTVTGTSTLWNTAVTGMGFNNVRAGGKIKFAGVEEVYGVASVASDTALTLTNRWSGDDLVAASYTYFEDEYALVADFHLPVDWHNFSLDLAISNLGPTEFRRRYPRNSITGKPQVATLIQLAFSGTTAPRYRVVFFPSPDLVYEIPYDYITSNLAVTSSGVEQAQLINTTDEPIIPLRYRHVLPVGAVYNYYRDVRDDERSKEAKAEYVDLVSRMAAESNPAKDHLAFSPQRKPRGIHRVSRFDSSSKRFDWDVGL